jgi:hypothetical protein
MIGDELQADRLGPSGGTHGLVGPNTLRCGDPVSNGTRSSGRSIRPPAGREATGAGPAGGQALMPEL